MEKETVIVTGAAGFIGSNMVAYLLENTSYDVIGIDNFLSGRLVYDKHVTPLEKSYPDRFSFIEVDYGKMEEAGIKSSIRTVFHFGATPRVSYSVEHPYETNVNNVGNSIALLDWCRAVGVKRFVFSSSSSIYGDVTRFPTSEIEVSAPKSPYALQKRTIEEYCRIYSNLYGLDTVCLRYFNVYGENQYAQNAYATVVSAWMDGFIKNKDIRMDGTGEQGRDFTHVINVCEANALVGGYKENFSGKIFNVANNDCTTLNQVLEIMTGMFGFCPGIIKKEFRAGDVFKTQADISSISEIGFSPKINFIEGMKRTYDWSKINLT